MTVRASANPAELNWAENVNICSQSGAAGKLHCFFLVQGAVISTAYFYIELQKITLLFRFFVLK